MAPGPGTTEVFAARRRAWWAHRQGLDGSLAGASPESVLARSGWARSVAGAGPYLTLFARTEAFVRDELGDARSFSLDSIKSRLPRLAALRSAGGR